MVHPDYIVKAGDAENLPLVEPVYPLTAGLSPKTLRKIIEAALPRIPRTAGMDRSFADAEAGIAFDRRQLSYAARTARPDGHRPAGACPATGSPMTSFLPVSCHSSLVRQRLRKVAGTPVHATGETQPARSCEALPFSPDAQPDRGDCRRPEGHGWRTTACCGCCRATSAPARRWWR